MAVLRPHLAITVTDVERSIPFYRALLGSDPAKVRAGWAKFESAEPALNLTLNEGEREGGLGAYNHAGIEVASTDDVLAAQARLREAGLATFDEIGTECCYARQDKIWASDPDGTPWEVFTVTGDSEQGDAWAASEARPAEPATCCSEADPGAAKQLPSPAASSCC
jgi:catechol 2,3-dioxygenase-like lactoylglutathione lyase family enzyme